MALRSLIWFAALAMVILRSFNIQRIDGSKPVELPKNHIVFLLDGSLSMSADDVEPNRFQQATDIISRTVSQSTGAEYSLIVFS